MYSREWSEWVKHSPVIAKWICEWTKRAFLLWKKTREWRGNQWTIGPWTEKSEWWPLRFQQFRRVTSIAPLGHYPQNIPWTPTELFRAPQSPCRAPAEPSKRPRRGLWKANFLGEPRGGLCPLDGRGGGSTPPWEVQCFSAMVPWHPDRHASATSPPSSNLCNNRVTLQWRRAGRRASPYCHPGWHANVVTLSWGPPP